HRRARRGTASRSRRASRGSRCSRTTWRGTLARGAGSGFPVPCRSGMTTDMRAVAQRVVRAEVEVAGAIVGTLERSPGLLVYLGAGRGDSDADVSWMVGKLAGLRIFEDEAGKMARSVADVGGSVLCISQFTLFGDVRRGLRPSFDGAA